MTIGNFDGVHRGHQTILSALRESAARHDLPSLVYTFAPHPMKVLAPSRAPALLASYAQKLELLESCGIDIVVEEPFTRAFASLTAAQFVQEVLLEALGTREVLAGQDFKFGQGGKGTVELLRELGAPGGLEVKVLGPFQFGGVTASSSKIRACVREGDMQQARTLLGRPFVLTGPIVRGEQRGRTIGFPTANLDAQQEIRPAHGVYACRALLEGQPAQEAVVNLGVRPTFATQGVTVEAHLLDFSGDLYGREMTLEFVEYLRPERSFPSVEQLVAQIREDSKQARQALRLASERAQGAPSEDTDR